MFAAGERRLVGFRRDPASGAIALATSIRGCAAPGPCRRSGRAPFGGTNGLLLAPSDNLLYAIADDFAATGTVTTLAVPPG